MQRLRASFGVLVSAIFLVSCSEGEETWDDPVGEAFPVDAGPVGAGAPGPGLGVSGSFGASLSGSPSESASPSASGSFTGTAPLSGAAAPQVAGGGVGYQTGYATGQPAPQTGYGESGAIRGEALVGGVPLVGGTVDESGGGNSVHSIGGMVIELP